MLVQSRETNVGDANLHEDQSRIAVPSGFLRRARRHFDP
jgi:hypothetical protein